MNEVDRTTGIGGSDIAAICGISPYRTPFGVYCEKLGLADPEPESERQKMGKVLEPVVTRLYEEASGTKVIWWNRTLRNPKEPLILGTPDGGIEKPIGTYKGVEFVEQMERGFEAKTAGLDQAWRWGDDGTVIPLEYVTQCQWYMLLTGFPQWTIAVLIGGEKFKHFPIDADEEIQAELLHRARQFWHDHIEARNPPEIDASPAAAHYLRRRYPMGIDPPREANTRERELMAAVLRHKQELKLLESRTTALENQLKDAIGNARGLYDPDSECRAMWSDVKESNVPAYVRKAYRSLTIRSRKEES